MGRTTARIISRLLVVGTIAATSLFALPGTSWASDRTHAAEELEFVSKINASRANRGLRALALDLQLTGVARKWADEMAQDGGISHNPQLANQVEGDWTRLGENVGYSSSSEASAMQFVDRLHIAFMNSPGHRANILGDYNQVGVGVRMTGHTMWVTVNFMKSATVVSNRAVKRAATVAGNEFDPEREDSGNHADYVVVTSSKRRPHKLGAAALGGDRGAVLHTHPASNWDESPVLHPRTRAEIDQLLGGAGLVYVVGDTGDVSAKAVRELTNDGYTVKRLDARTQTGTLVKVARETVRRHGDTDRVVITGRKARKPAVAAANWAASTDAPFVMTPRDRLADSVRDFLSTYRPARRWVVGDSDVVSSRVKRAADAQRIAVSAL